VLAGELSLSGRLRPAGRADRRLAEARRIGFERLVTGPMRDEAQRARPPDGLLSAVDLRAALTLALSES
jgi:predicted ATP-dependent serine protease